MLVTFIVLYLLASIAIGLYAATRVHNTADYAVAGRSLPLAVVIATTFATWFGSETVLGVSARFIDEGLGGVVEDPFGASMCLILVGLFFAYRLYQKNLITLGDYYRLRFGRTIEVLCSCIIMFSYLGWVAAQITALGLVFNLLTQGAISVTAGMVLMRLFQTSRRFNVEIQPQLVLLQKTLLNIEGLGRQLDPDLALWSTAKPFLEKWMLEQLGPQRFKRELQTQAPHYAKILPSLPRLLHDFLQHPPGRKQNQELLELLREQKRTNRLLQGLMYGGLGFVLGLIVMQVIVRVRVF